MFKRMQEVGQFLRSSGHIDKTELLVDQIDGKVLKCQLEVGSSQPFQGLTMADIQDGGTALLYKMGKGNQYPLSPTYKATNSDPVESILEDWYKSVLFPYGRKNDCAPTSDEFIYTLRKAYHDQKSTIEQAVQKEVEQYSGSDTLYLSVDFIKDGEHFAVRDVDIICDALRFFVRSGEWTGPNGPGHGTCSFCGQTADVYGEGLPFYTFSVNDARLAPDFDRTQSWRGSPVCKECLYDLHAAKQIMDRQDYRWQFGPVGRNFFVLPHYLNNGPQNDALMNHILDPHNEERDFTDAERVYQIGDQITEPIQLDFIVYEYSSNGRIKRINRYIREVIPSWAHNVEDTHYDLAPAWWSAYTSDNKPSRIDSLIGSILPRAAISSGSEDDGYLEEGLGLIEAIFTQKPISIKRLYRYWIRELQARFRQPDEYMKTFVRKTFYFQQLLQEIDLLQVPEGSNMDQLSETLNESANEARSEKVEAFLDSKAQTFNSAGKCAAFIEGVLVGHLINVQQAQRGDAPFREKLFGMRLNKARLRKLVPELYRYLDIYHDKSDDQYQTRYPKIRASLAQYLIEAEEQGWKNTTDDDATYFFSLGMSLNQNFKGGNEDDE